LQEIQKPVVIMAAVVMAIMVAMAIVVVVVIAVVITHLVVITALQDLVLLTIPITMATIGHPVIGDGIGGVSAFGLAATGGKFSF
jgi:hypothetical protein